MLKRYLITITVLLSLTCLGQTNLPVGQGVIKIDFANLPTLYFYADTNAAKPSNTIAIGKDKEGEFIIKNSKEADTWFMPEQLSLEYDIFIIRVDTVIGKWYKVVTNTETATFLWTKAGPIKKFMKWPVFLLKETTAVERGVADIDIKVSPSESAKTIKKIEENDCFEVLEIKGDWMKVRTNTKLDCSESKRPVKSGWLKWRDKNRLMISFGLTC